MSTISRANTPHLSPARTRRRGHRALRVACLAAFLVSAAQAQSPSTANGVLTPEGAAALRQLLQTPAAGGLPPASGASTAPNAADGANPSSAQRPFAAGARAGAGPRIQVIVQRGETLDRVIARTLRDSPFRPEVLREAFMRLNRSAFPRGTPHWVTAGAVLQVPTFADVMAGIDPQLWSPGMAHAVPDPSSGPTTQRTEADRKNWIRYP